MVQRLLLLLFLFTQCFLLAQNQIPVNKYDTIQAYDVNNKFTGTDPDLHHFRIIAAYSQMTFSNDSLSTGILTQNLEQKYGFTAGFELFFKYFKFGGRYTRNVFEIINPLTINSDELEEITVNGGEGLFDIMLMPQIKHLSLYAGGGYTFQMSDFEGENGEKLEIQEPIWNVGIDLFVGRGFKFFGEYVQTFDNTSNNAYRRLNGGFGFTF